MEKNKVKFKERGVTLIALVITIIVLLILAGVALAMLTGDSGILSNAENAAIDTERSGIEEQARLIYSEMAIGKYTGEIDEISMLDIANGLKQKGYTIENVASSENVTDIILDATSLSIAAGGTGTIKVTYKGASGESAYYAVIKGKYYKITQGPNGITVERTATEVNSGSGKILTAEVTSGSTAEVGEINGNEILVKAGSTGGQTEITVTYGENTKTCKVTVVDTSVANSEDVLFPTTYGTIEVIWLDGTTNDVSQTPNSPANALTSGEESLKAVAFDEESKDWKELETTDNKNNNWYKYEAGSQVRGADGKLVDNNASYWANAKTANGSYFVWIPRYAYRITYYENETSTTPTGYYDGYGMWKADNGAVKYALDDGIETKEHNGNNYIVHPAFCNEYSNDGDDTNDFLNGGWDSDLTGFWVAKFEMAETTGGALNSAYGTASVGSQTIGTQYTNARNATYGYIGITNEYGNKSFMNSHMMKNSEWGAVAYLTQSQYGRNGKEITTNNNGTTYYRGGGTEKAYIDNALQSTTGNVYGVYDMSGNRFERTAAFNSKDERGYFPKYGWSGLTISSNSTKYATKYNSEINSSTGNVIIYKYGKIGDATKEVNTGGAYAGTSTTGYYNWFSDDSGLAVPASPFFERGRCCF